LNTIASKSASLPDLHRDPIDRIIIATAIEPRWIGGYNCRTACRVGKEQCTGYRIATVDLDAAVLHHLANEVCTLERTRDLFEHVRIKKTRDHVDERTIMSMWRSLITANSSIGRTYVQHLIKQIIVYANRVEVVAHAHEPMAASGF